MFFIPKGPLPPSVPTTNLDLFLSPTLLHVFVLRFQSSDHFPDSIFHSSGRSTPVSVCSAGDIARIYLIFKAIYLFQIMMGANDNQPNITIILLQHLPLVPCKIII
ncbi:hypothetical protein ABFS82_08G110300 [Erythranthe guttata]